MGWWNQKKPKFKPGDVLEEIAPKDRSGPIRFMILEEYMPVVPYDQKKNKGRCVNCPEADITMVDTKRSMKMLVACKMKPEMKIDQFTRQPDWCPLKTEMQTPIELPNIPDDQGVAFINETT